MTSLRSAVPTVMSALLISSALFAQITPGNLVVVRIGDGTAALTNAAQPVFLDQFTPLGGAPVSTLSLPTTAVGNNHAVTNSGTATSEGSINQTEDGRYLLTVGYDAAPGTTSVASTSSSAVNRVIARTALSGGIDTSTALVDAYSGNNIRSAASDDGTRFWTGGPSGGTRFVAALGDSTSTLLSTLLTNTRWMDIHQGQLYSSSSSGAFKGVSTYGTGLPTVGGQVPVLLAGFPSDASASPYDWFFADANTLYVTDDRGNGMGGIQKWVQTAGSWSLQYTLAPASGIGCRGLSGAMINGVATLYATTTEITSNNLVTVIDNGAGSPFSVLSTAGTDQVFRGVRLVRCPSAGTSFFGQATAHSGGTPDLSVSAPFVLGSLPFINANGMLPGNVALYLIGFRMPAFDLSLIGAQPGAELYVSIQSSVAIGTDAFGFATFPLSVPALPSLCGAELTWQAIQLDASLPFGLPVATSRGMTTRIGI